MSNLVNPTLAAVLDENPEIRSFIYQQIVDFENFVTPQTMVSVMAKDPMKLQAKLEADGETVNKKKLSKMYRIAIVLKEDDTKIQEEGLHEDIFEAIKMAKGKLINKLVAIQDQVISQQERIEQINQALTNPNIH
jgi:ribosome-associated translation inhibitor RaiA